MIWGISAKLRFTPVSGVVREYGSTVFTSYVANFICDVISCLVAYRMLDINLLMFVYRVVFTRDPLCCLVCCSVHRTTSLSMWAERSAWWRHFDRFVISMRTATMKLQRIMASYRMAYDWLKLVVRIPSRPIHQYPSPRSLLCFSLFLSLSLSHHFVYMISCLFNLLLLSKTPRQSFLPACFNSFFCVASSPSSSPPGDMLSRLEDFENQLAGRIIKHSEKIKATISGRASPDSSSESGRSNVVSLEYHNYLSYARPSEATALQQLLTRLHACKEMFYDVGMQMKMSLAQVFCRNELNSSLLPAYSALQTGYQLSQDTT